MASTSDKPLSEIIRNERQARAWSQEHLAEAAGLNLRTVQRVERGLTCSGETIQSLAGALDLDSGLLAAAAPALRQNSRWFGLSGTQAASFGAMLCLPGLVFVAVNLVHYEIAMGALEPLVMSQVWAAITANPLTPAIVMGGPLLAFVLNVPYIVRLRIRRELDATVVDGLAVHWRTGQFIVGSCAFFLIAIMLVYGAVENLGHMISGA